MNPPRFGIPRGSSPAGGNRAFAGIEQFHHDQVMLAARHPQGFWYPASLKSLTRNGTDQLGEGVERIFQGGGDEGSPRLGFECQHIADQP